jgi:hypothetical protein
MRDVDGRGQPSGPLGRFGRLVMTVATFGAIGPLAGGFVFAMLFSVIGLSPSASLAGIAEEMLRFVPRIIHATFLNGWKQALGAGLIFGTAEMFGHAGWLMAILVGAVAGVLVIPLDRVMQPNPFIVVIALCGVAGALASYWLIRRTSGATS